MKTIPAFSLLKLTVILAFSSALSLRAADTTSDNSSNASNSSSSNTSASSSTSDSSSNSASSSLNNPPQQPQQQLSGAANADTNAAASAAASNPANAQAQLNADATAQANDAQALQDQAKDQSEVRHRLNEQLSNATDFYTSLQSKAETEIPSHVVTHARGILIINRWSAGAGASATGGYAIGMKRMSDGNFSAPVFYSLAGASLYTEAVGEKTSTVAFLMTDKAVRILSDDNFALSGNLKVVTGSHSYEDTTIDNTADVLLYQKAKTSSDEKIAEDLDARAVAAAKVALDEASTQKFYSDSHLRVDDVFSGKVSAPAFSKTVILVYLNQQSHGIRPSTPETMAMRDAAININSSGSAHAGVGVGVQGTAGGTESGAVQTVGGVTAGVAGGVTVGAAVK